MYSDFGTIWAAKCRKLLQLREKEGWTYQRDCEKETAKLDLLK